jgi:zeta-carotene isomerase
MVYFNAVILLCTILVVSGYIPPRSCSKATQMHSRCLRTSFSPSTLQKQTTSTTLLATTSTNQELVGEEAAKFSLEDQSLKSWVTFGAAVATVLSVLFYLWIYEGGPQLGDSFKATIEGFAGGDTTLATIYMNGFFGVVHSGLASLRPSAEKIIGPRAWRVVFAMASLPLAFSCIVYFINHRYDGQVLWDLRSIPAMHSFVWITSFLSFFFLYPSTFNLLEVAAVDKPQLHLWETGIIRITRHPQMVGQVMWCAAHTAYLGTTFTCATSTMLCLHHLFAVWNGDRRLRDKYGEKADIVQSRTSTVPFAAILDGRQQLPEDYYKEFLTLPYLVIAVATTAAYFAHPFMQAGSALVNW